jgi:hypothetical protein
MKDFLEWLIQFNLTSNGDPAKFDCGAYIDTISQMTWFYNQTFKPDMITEYFEGTEQTIKDGWKWMYKSENNRAIYFAVNFTESHQYTISGYGWTKPQTLNDFISDCNHVGIRLTPKPAILQKYPMLVTDEA